jgi:small-conductance mechanosensitive channel
MLGEGPNGALQLFGITLIGATPDNFRRLLLTLGFILGLLLVGKALRWAVGQVSRRLRQHRRAAFWTAQAVNILVAAVMMLGIGSIWFDDPGRLATAFGLVTAGLAFALQRVITAMAGYLVILRGETFNLGDRIVMGGVRGDVVALSFTQTTILEMGGSEAGAAPRSWVHGRQYTGRIVTVSNAKVFDEPVYNFTREFPFIWEEMVLPIRYEADRERAEAILLEAAARHTAEVMAAATPEVADLRQRFDLPGAGVRPRTYLRLASGYLEVTVRFLARTHGVRELKDAISREVLERFEAAGIGVAAPSYAITMPGAAANDALPGRWAQGHPGR